MPNNLDDKETKAQTAFSRVYKERIQNMPDDIDDIDVKEILVYSKNIIKLVKDLNKIGKGKKIPKNNE
jgi:hypothetical protein